MFNRLRHSLSVLLLCASVFAGSGCSPEPEETVYVFYDSDSDGFGSGEAVQQKEVIANLQYYALNNNDCNDSNWGINPGRAEICDDVDNNCNNIIDDGVQTAFYLDADQDGYGDPWGENIGHTIKGCEAPTGYVEEWGDCDDNNENRHPGADETCNGQDDDCNGDTDGGSYLWYPDTDGDGYGDMRAQPTEAFCPGPTGHVDNNDDCNDKDATVHSGQSGC